MEKTITTPSQREAELREALSKYYEFNNVLETLCNNGNNVDVSPLYKFFREPLKAIYDEIVKLLTNEISDEILTITFNKED